VIGQKETDQDLRAHHLIAFSPSDANSRQYQEDSSLGQRTRTMYDQVVHYQTFLHFNALLTTRTGSSGTIDLQLGSLADATPRIVILPG
jgi:hypothetical protein